MSLFKHFYLDGGGSFPVKFCDCKGGDGGAAARAEAALKRQQEKDQRIRDNIDLITTLFDNDPSQVGSEIGTLGTERSALPPGFYKDVANPDFDDGISVGAGNQRTIPEFQDPSAPRRLGIDARLRILNSASGLLTGPSKTERESSVIGDVENFFFEDLKTQKTRESRNLRFELSRRAGFGGSQEIDAIEEFQRKEDRGRLDIGNVALGARDNLRTQDAALKANLIDQANKDIRRNVLTNNFIGDLGSGLARATDTAKLTQFDPFFENAGQLFSNVAIAQAGQRGTNNAQRQLSFFAGDPKSNSGIITR